MKTYVEGHPLNKKEEAEEMSGIARMRGEFEERQRAKGLERSGREGGVMIGRGSGGWREGKLNVFVDGRGD